MGRMNTMTAYHSDILLTCHSLGTAFAAIGKENGSGFVVVTKYVMMDALEVTPGSVLLLPYVSYVVMGWACNVTSRNDILSHKIMTNISMSRRRCMPIVQRGSHGDAMHNNLQSMASKYWYFKVITNFNNKLKKYSNVAIWLNAYCQEKVLPVFRGLKTYVSFFGQYIRVLSQVSRETLLFMLICTPRKTQ